MKGRLPAAAKRALLASLLLLSAPGCLHHGSAKAFKPDRLETEQGWLVVRDVPVVRQTTPSNCGAASMSMVLGHWGSELTIEEIADAIPPGLADGSFRAGDLRDFARARGMHAFVIAGDMGDLQAQLEKKRPVIVGLVKRVSRKRTLSHYEVVVGYDATTQRVLMLDPAHGWREDTVAGFLKEWDSSGRLALIAFP